MKIEELLGFIGESNILNSPEMELFNNDAKLNHRLSGKVTFEIYKKLLVESQKISGLYKIYCLAVIYENRQGRQDSMQSIKAALESLPASLRTFRDAFKKDKEKFLIDPKDDSFKIHKKKDCKDCDS